MLYEVVLKPIFHEIIMGVLHSNPDVVTECVTALAGTGIKRNTIIGAVSRHDTNSETEYRVWRSIIQKVVVYPGHLLEFHIIDGTITPYQMLQTTPRKSQLTQATRTKILQAYSMGQSPASIAKELNIPSSTIHSMIWRAKKRAKRPAFVCQNCGKSFFAAKGKKERKYCNWNCYLEARTCGK